MVLTSWAGRFGNAAQLCSWAGLTPRHRESDTKVSRGHVTKQGSRMLRWAVTEAIQRQPAGSRPRQVKDGIIARRGKEAKNTAKVAAARELLTAKKNLRLLASLAEGRGADHVVLTGGGTAVLP